MTNPSPCAAKIDSMNAALCCMEEGDGDTDMEGNALEWSDVVGPDGRTRKVVSVVAAARFFGSMDPKLGCHSFRDPGKASHEVVRRALLGRENYERAYAWIVCRVWPGARDPAEKVAVGLAKAAIDAGVTLVLAYAAAFVRSSKDRYELLRRAIRSKDTGPLSYLLRTWDPIPMTNVASKIWKTRTLLAIAAHEGQVDSVDLIVARTKVVEWKKRRLEGDDGDFSEWVSFKEYGRTVNHAFNTLNAPLVKALLGNPETIRAIRDERPNVYRTFVGWGTAAAGLHPSAWTTKELADFYTDVYPAIEWLSPSNTSIISVLTTRENWERGIPFIRASYGTTAWAAGAADRFNTPLLAWLLDNVRGTRVPSSIYRRLRNITRDAYTDVVREFAQVLEQAPGPDYKELSKLYLRMEDTEGWDRVWVSSGGLGNKFSMSHSSLGFVIHIIGGGYRPGHGRTLSGIMVRVMTEGPVEDRASLLQTLLASPGGQSVDLNDLACEPPGKEEWDEEKANPSKEYPVFSAFPVLMEHMKVRSGELEPWAVAKYARYAELSGDTAFSAFLRETFGEPIIRDLEIRELYKDSENLSFEEFKRAFDAVSARPDGPPGKRQRT
jgi:hypothetical protein